MKHSSDASRTRSTWRLFIAREAVDHHFKMSFDIVNPESSWKKRITTALRAVPFYAAWYPTRWVGTPKTYGEFGRLAKHLRFAERQTRKLGRTIFHAMVRIGPKLERRQMVLFRAVDIGAELFAISASCVRAQMLAAQGQKEAIVLADLFCREARRRIREHFANFYGRNDAAIYRVSQQVLRGEHAWLEQGIVGLMGPGSGKREAGSGTDGRGAGRGTPRSPAPAVVGN